ncbi:protein of unknown function [Paraburkholderia kururiensis]
MRQAVCFCPSSADWQPARSHDVAQPSNRYLGASNNGKARGATAKRPVSSRAGVQSE